MDEESNTAKAYDIILRGAFLPKANRSSQGSSSKEKQPVVEVVHVAAETASAAAEEPGASSTRKESTLKKVVQCRDKKGAWHVVSPEKYKARTQKSKPPYFTSLDKEDFSRYAILFKAILAHDKRARPEFLLEIQSEGLKRTFRRIAKHHRELDLNTGKKKPIVIKAPYHCLFFLRKRLRELQTAEETPQDVRQELTDLLTFIHDPLCLRQTIEAYEELVPQRKISFRILWTLYPPDEPVLNAAGCDNLSMATCCLVDAVRSVRIHDGVSGWEVDLLNTWHDGHESHLIKTPKCIAYFEGVKEISAAWLDLLPLHLFSKERQDGFRRDMIERGIDYFSFCNQDFAYLRYEGRATVQDPISMAWKEGQQLDTRVVVDPRTKQEPLDPKTVVVADCLEDRIGRIRVAGEDEDEDEVEVEVEVEEEDDEIEKMEEAEKTLPSFLDGKDKAPDLEHGILDDAIQLGIPLDNGGQFRRIRFLPSDDDYLICLNNLVVFVLDGKYWAKKIDMDGLVAFYSNQAMETDLRLEYEKRSLLLSLTRRFQDDKEAANPDLGFVFLLHGGPGLGKSFTAKVIAEVTKRPLYQVSAGEITGTVNDVTRQLRTIFTLSARWKAIVLIDDADILMAKRTPHDHDRNAIVAVLLQMLESYKGLLFLTTNRLEDLDEAFISRCHVRIEYEPLSRDSRRAIWQNHLRFELRRNQDVWFGRGLDPDKREPILTEMCLALAELPTNGHEIKNCVQTAERLVRAKQRMTGQQTMGQPTIGQQTLGAEVRGDDGADHGQTMGQAMGQAMGQRIGQTRQTGQTGQTGQQTISPKVLLEVLRVNAPQILPPEYRRVFAKLLDLQKEYDSMRRATAEQGSG